MRMKAHMSTHVDGSRHTMFKECTEEVKNRLTKMCRQVEESMSNKADEVLELMRRDYITAITGAQLPAGQEMPKAQRNMMAAVARIIDEREAECARLMDQDVELAAKVEGEVGEKPDPSLLAPKNEDTGETVMPDYPAARDDSTDPFAD